jgi:uncharacterized membrane protein YhiD involved in acid resistance
MGYDKIKILEDFLTTNIMNINIYEFVLNLFIGAILSLILSMVYNKYGRSISTRNSSAVNFLSISMTTLFVISIVKSSFALSLGLVGALSIVRFRTAIKDPEELAYIFFSVAVGLGLGANQRIITLIAFVTIVFFMIVLSVHHTKKRFFNLHLTVSKQGTDQVDLDYISSTLNTCCEKVELRRFAESEAKTEVMYLIEIKKISDFNEIQKKIKINDEDLRLMYLNSNGLG